MAISQLKNAKSKRQVVLSSLPNKLPILPKKRRFPALQGVI
jgi:hypothetical protein